MVGQEQEMEMTKRSAKTQAREANEEKGMKEVKRKKKNLEKNAVAEDSEDEESYGDQKPGSNLLEFAAQKAMTMVAKMCDELSVKWQGSNIQPTNSIWSKLSSAYMRKYHPDFRHTFTTFESFNCQLGRFLAAMIYFTCELSPKFLPGGVYVWRHGWFEKSDKKIPKCLHGIEMEFKPRSVELSAVSEAGKKAIAENGASIEKNKYGKPVVVIKFDKNVVCFKDAHHGGFPNPHASGSCAMVFSDSDKAVQAFTHDIEWTKSIYPNVEPSKIEERIMIGGNCMCNYAVESSVPGRQLCKMVPYKMNGADDISDEIAKVRKDMEIHKTYAHTMVFLCCNPNNNTRGGLSASQKQDKSCGWKISAIDLRFAYIFANEIYHKVFGETTSPKLTEFKWFNGFSYKSSVIQPAVIQEATEIF